MDVLPIEVLNIILNLIKDDQASLLALNRTNSYLNRLCTPLLYRSPSFSNLQRLEAFILHARPDAALHVKSLDFLNISHRWDREFSSLFELLLTKTNNVEEIMLDYSTISPNSFTHIESLPHVRYLSFVGTKGVRDQLVYDVSFKCPSIRAIDLSKTPITDNSLKAIALNCQQMESVDLAGCEKITEAGVRCLTEHLSNLRYLNVANCYNVVASQEELDRGGNLDIVWSDGEDEYETETTETDDDGHGSD